MWSATKPTEVGRYGWRPSPAEPGRPVDIVNTGVYFTIDATGHVVEGGEWWQGPTLYAWEQAVSAETASEAFTAWKKRCDQSDGFRPCAESFEVGFEAGRAAEPVNAELLAAYRELVQRIDNSRPCSMGGIHNAREVQFGVEEIYRWRELIERCEQQPDDTRDAEIARMRAALEWMLSAMEAKVHSAQAMNAARAALEEKP